MPFRCNKCGYGKRQGVIAARNARNADVNVEMVTASNTVVVKEFCIQTRQWDG